MAGLMAESMKDRLIKKFEDEIHTLDRELKVELPREILRARELGDLRENAEYHAAKERQRLVESRISMLQKRVSEIALLNVDRIPTDRAGFGSTLHVVEKTGDKLIFQLVMPEDADAAKGLISTTSPIGRAFLNKEEGDTVKVTTPGGTREFEIIKLLTIHDEAAANASNANS
jgi:transcription elongation factor GreA